MMIKCNSINTELRKRSTGIKRMVLLPPARGCIKRGIFSSLFQALKVTARGISRHLLCKYSGEGSSYSL
jgi:hypothetical protein